MSLTFKSKNISKSRKSLIFTIDGILAMSVIFVAVAFVFFSFSKVNSTQFAEQSLSKTAMDSLTVLEKEHTLSSAIETSDTSYIKYFLNATDNSICANITLYNASDTVKASTSKSNCSSSEFPKYANRVFVGNNKKAYHARMGVWFNEK